MYCCAHKTATLTPIQHTVPPPVEIGLKERILINLYMSMNLFFVKNINESLSAMLKLEFT